MTRQRVLAISAMLLGATACGRSLTLDGHHGTGGGGELTLGPDGGVTAGLPCDVQAVLSASCWSCHGLTPTLGSPRLVTVGDLEAASTHDPAQSNAERAIARMEDAIAPMPPGLKPTASASDVAILSAFVAAGYQAPACDTVVVPSSDPLLDAAPTCTGNQFWPSNQLYHGSRKMNPGMACIACHSTSGGEAPRETIAGTVYPTGHEPDLCEAALSGAVTVVVTGADGFILNLVPNSVGNFESHTHVALPYTAKVVANGKERLMLAPQTSGDCNSCHTQNGASNAPGRITVPAP